MSAVFMRDSQVVVWVPCDRAPGDLREMKIEGADVYVGGARPPIEVRRWIEQGATFVAHNAEGFDAQAWKKFGEGEPTWCDTMLFCRAGGLPAGLDRACKALGIPGKDEHGAAALKLLYAAKDTGRGIHYNVGTAALWQLMLRYNVQDVLILRELWERVKGYGEPDVMEMSARINDRGLPVDRAFAQRLKEVWVECQAGAKKDVNELTEGEISGDDIRSVPKVKRWLASQGLNVRSLDRKSLEQMMADPDGFFGDPDDETVQRVKAVIYGRQQAVRATVGKLDRLFAVMDDDCRVRYTMAYHAALTGRYAGRDFQPHNMPRGVGKLDVESLVGKGPSLTLADVATAAEPHKASTGDALATLMRPVIRARPGHVLAAVDFGAIESRGTAWVARCHPLLSVFEADGDPYLDMARKVFGPNYTGSKDQRQVGKVIILGCLAEGTPVMTDRGWVDVEDVSEADRVWDGCEWVSHDGAVCTGVKIVREVCGVWMTDDHEVLTDRGWAESWLLDGRTHSRPSATATDDGRLWLMCGGSSLDTSPACDADATAGGRRMLGKPDGMSRGCRSTGSRITVTTNRATSGSRRGAFNCGTAARAVRTFDVLNAGPRHRYQAGSLIVHNCGYGMGHAKFAVSASLMGANLKAAGVTAEDCVRAYREGYPEIPRVWKAYDRAVKDAIAGHPSVAGRCYWEMIGADLVCTLPSARRIFYRDARAGKKRPPWNPSGPPIDAVMYSNPRGYVSDLYGGLLCENVVQAISRDLLVDAMLRVERSGWDIVLHVHDEIVCEVREQAARDCLNHVADIMRTPPEWAKTLPLAVEGFTCPHYVKSPWKGGLKV